MSAAKLFLTPNEITSSAQVGAKAYSLAQLLERGFAVPPFICMTCDDASKPFETKTLDLPSLVLEGHEVNGKAEPISTKCATGTVPNARFSVRSSSVHEDGATASYAGQYESYLNIPEVALRKAVQQCAAALHSSQRAEQYRQARGASKEHTPTGKGSIIIQTMIDSDLSGVAFSANPQGLLNEAVVVCGSYTGDKVVEDKTPTTTYYYNLSDDRYYFEQATNAPLLEESHLTELIDALRILSDKGPVDIEFAIKDGQLWFLQMRPITTLSDQAPLVLDSSNIVESYPGLSLPLTISFAKYVYCQVFTGLARRCMPDEAMVKQYADTLENMVASANGRMYYQISNWYALLKFLPFQKRIVPVWQRMLGVEDKSYDEQPPQITFRQRLNTYRSIISSAIGIPKKMEALQADFNAADTLFKKQFRPDASSQELLDLYEKIAALVLVDWDVTLLNDLYAFIYTCLLERQFKKASHEDDGEDYRSRSNRYLSGIHELESMEPVRQAFRLARDIAADEKLHLQLKALANNEDVLDYLSHSDPFAQQLVDYLDAYGDRCFEELKLETKTFRSDPYRLVEMLLAYASKDQDDPSDAVPSGASQQPGESLPHSGGPLRRFFIQHFGKKAALGIANRESSRLNRSRIFGMVRAIFLAIGENLVSTGVLNDQRDVFYLLQEELFDHVRGNAEGSHFKHLVEKRKEDYLGFSKLPAYSRLLFSKHIFDKHPLNASQNTSYASTSTLHGTPCSSGKTVGKVVVVTSPVSADQVQDKILVAKTTDPGWVYLLAVAKGIIAEKGSLLSHTAIVSRELGVPSVVGVDRATEILKSGDWVVLDGDGGIIKRVSS